MPSLARSVPKPLKVPSLARSVQKPLKVPSLARSVPKPHKIGQAQACERGGEGGGEAGAPKPVGFQPLSLVAADFLLPWLSVAIAVRLPQVNRRWRDTRVRLLQVNYE